MFSKMIIRRIKRDHNLFSMYLKRGNWTNFTRDYVTTRNFTYKHVSMFNPQGSVHVHIEYNNVQYLVRNGVAESDFLFTSLQYS